MKNRTLAQQTPEKIGQEVTLAGWVAVRRDHGKLVFIDLRDHTGIVQVVINPKVSEDAHKVAERIRSEFVVTITGTVKERPKELVNKNLPTGSIEVEAQSIAIIDSSETPPFDILGDGQDIGEEHRLKYRYLDLRRPRLQENLKLRHKINQFLRNYLSAQNFTEVETPYISKSTPEGARDYVVPSRLHPGKFYALPQSPQQYKQLLMIAGLEKYFQIVRCFRDEDTRGDRQPEFTQLDIELSFTNQEEILSLVEDLMREMVSTILPGKIFSTVPFPRLTYQETLEKYGSDRPDLRKDKNDTHELAFAFIVNFPMFEVKDDGSLGAVHHPFTLPAYDTSLDPSLLRSSTPEGQKLLEKLSDRDEALKLFAFQYDLVCNGYEIAGGSIRTFDREILKKTFETLGLSTEDFQKQFGHLFEAFTYGVPPHGGIALGLDRVVAILTGEPNIREVMAFPKTGDARDLLMGAPSEVPGKALKEAHIKLDLK